MPASAFVNSSEKWVGLKISRANDQPQLLCGTANPKIGVSARTKQVLTGDHTADQHRPQICRYAATSASSPESSDRAGYRSSCRLMNAANSASYRLRKLAFNLRQLALQKHQGVWAADGW